MKKKVLVVHDQLAVRYYANFNLDSVYVECMESLTKGEFSTICPKTYSADEGCIIGFEVSEEKYLSIVIKIVDTILEEVTGVKPSHV